MSTGLIVGKADYEDMYFIFVSRIMYLSLAELQRCACYQFLSHGQPVVTPSLLNSAYDRDIMITLCL